MALGNSGFKLAPRALFSRNKAQNADNNALSQEHTKSSSEVLKKAKLKFNRQCRKTAVLLHHHADTKPTTTAANPPDFTIPPIEFPPTNFSILPTESFSTLQRVVIDSTATHHIDSVNISDSDAPVVVPSTTVSPSAVPCLDPVPTSLSKESNGIEGDSPTNSTSSTNTTLSVHLTTATTPRKLTKPQPKLPSIVVPGHKVPATQSNNCSKAMANKGNKAPRQKIVDVLHKLRAKLWLWNHPENSSIALEEEEEDFSDRCQWDVVRKIERNTILEILRSSLATCAYGGPLYRRTPMMVVSTTQGSYHLVFMVKVFNPYSLVFEGWVVKIPGHGTPGRWTADDEYMLTQEAETMRLLVMYTDVPAPFAFDYSATLDNKFGFPYIVMNQLPGKSASELWFEQHGEVPTPETEMKRLTFLRSLARHMTELDKLRFDQIGIPVFNPYAEDFENYDDIEAERLPVNKYYVWPYYDTYDSVERGPFPSTQAYIHHARDDTELPLPYPDRKLTVEQVEVFGTRKLLDIIFAHPVFHTTSTDTFTLRHSDLDTQNILIDDSGAITGILDWDASLAMPRCVGHAAVPHFLDRDFHRDAVVNTPFLCWRAPHYRSVYAAALVEAGNPDAKYTTKSHVYQAAFAALYEGGNMEDFMTRLVNAIPGLQMSLEGVKFLLAKGCKATEDMLKVELWKLLEPELPEVGFLERVEKQHAEAAVQVWMDGFEGLVVDEM